ncbi:MAG: SDR family NAD(P)-dependent oxidoreductase, partial [Bacteroidetes bacterium]|nr:SDR family NAD(P)-dependent oxidoreductase [Bacteroidota bacterium]
MQGIPSYPWGTFPPRRDRKACVIPSNASLERILQENSLIPQFHLPMPETHSRLIVLTGAASGLGRLLTERFLASGDRVAGLDIDDAALERLSQSSGTSFYPYPVDLADPDAIERVFTALQQDLGPVDILINNAGVVAGKYFLEHTREDIERTFAINTLSHFHTARAVLPDMIAQERGHIVTIASAGGLAATSRLSAY